MVNNQTEQKNRRTGLLLSVVIHTVLIALLAIFSLSWLNPPPEPGGILVNLGIPDVGQGNENAPQGDPAPVVEESKPEPVEESTPPPAPEEPKEVTKPKPEPKKEVKRTEDPEAAALKKRKEEERRKKAAEDRKRAEEERKRKAAEAKKKAEAEAKKAAEDAKRKELEDLVAGGLGGGSGSGKGNTGKPGNQGDPGGDPNAGNLSGISTGSGMVGGAIGNRVARKGPAIRDNSQEEGTVVIRICVDGNGNVVGQPEFTQSGSSTNSRKLINLAIANAKKWKFSKADIDKQCGTIRYEFKLK